MKIKDLYLIVMQIQDIQLGQVFQTTNFMDPENYQTAVTEFSKNMKIFWEKSEQFQKYSCLIFMY